MYALPVLYNIAGTLLFYLDSISRTYFGFTLNTVWLYKQSTVPFLAHP